MVIALLRRELPKATVDNDGEVLLKQVKEARSRGQHVVYVSMGQSISHTRDFYKTLMEDLGDDSADHQVTVVLALGKASELGRRFESIDEWKTWWNQQIPRNFIVAPFVPQAAVLELADIFITHAGAGGITEAMISAVPMITMPGTLDQPWNARVVAGKGMAIDLGDHVQYDDGDEISVVKGKTIEAVRQMLASYMHYKQAAEQACSIYKSGLGPAAAADELVRVADLKPSGGYGWMIQNRIPRTSSWQKHKLQGA